MWLILYHTLLLSANVAARELVGGHYTLCGIEEHKPALFAAHTPCPLDARPGAEDLRRNMSCGMIDGRR